MNRKTRPVVAQILWMAAGRFEAQTGWLLFRRPHPGTLRRFTRAGLQGLFSLLIVASMTGAVRLYAWGPAAHRLVNNWAVETLPPDVRPFFEASRHAAGAKIGSRRGLGAEPVGRRADGNHDLVVIAVEIAFEFQELLPPGERAGQALSLIHISEPTRPY